MQVHSIGSITAPSVPHKVHVIHFEVSPKTHGKDMAVEAVVLPTVATDVPSTSVSFNNRWMHLSKLQVAHLNFGSPESSNLILGADVLRHAVRHSQRFWATRFTFCIQDSFQMGPGWYH